MSTSSAGHVAGPAATVGRATAAAAPDRQPVPVAQAGRTEARQEIGRAAPEHGGHVDATGHREVGAHAGLGRADVEHRAVGNRDGPAHRGRRPVHRDRRGWAGHRDDARPDGPQRDAHDRRLEHGRRGIVADGRVRGGRRGAVERAGAGHAEVGEARATLVLHGRQRAGPHHLQRAGRLAHGPTGTKRTRSPGAISAGSGPARVPQDGVGPPDQVPAARRRRRVDRGVLAGHGHRTGRDPRSRGRPAGQVPGRREPDQVGEARGEPAERGPQVGRRCARPPRPRRPRPHCSATHGRSSPS